MSTLRINATILAELKLAKMRLEALVTPGTACAVDDVHKEAIRLYVESWITPVVESAIARIEGKKKSPRGGAHRIPRHP